MEGFAESEAPCRSISLGSKRTEAAAVGTTPSDCAIDLLLVAPAGACGSAFGLGPAQTRLMLAEHISQMYHIMLFSNHVEHLWNMFAQTGLRGCGKLGTVRMQRGPPTAAAFPPLEHHRTD
jgi:hypothetical protein